jgi:hypothetical protein
MTESPLHIASFSSLAEVLEIVDWAIRARTDCLAPVALLDLDGTIWAGDIGYASLDVALHRGLLAKGHQPSIKELYKLLAHDDGDDLRSLLLKFESAKPHTPRLAERSYWLETSDLPSPDAVSLLEKVYALCAGVFNGMEETDLSALVTEALYTYSSQLGRSSAGPGVANTVRQDVSEIRSLLRSHGLLELVVTASPARIARGASSIIGVPPDHIIRRPLPIHLGKGHLAADWCHNRQLHGLATIAIGDSPLLTDYGLLRQSALFIDVSGEEYRMIVRRGVTV